MVHGHRGEIEAMLDGQSHRLCLTLGALADLETTFGDADIHAVAERFSGGRLKAADAARLIGAGLRGGGHSLSDTIVTTMTADGGAVGFIDIVARLLAATFGPAAGMVAGPVVEAITGAIRQSAQTTDEQHHAVRPVDLVPATVPTPEEERTPAGYAGDLLPARPPLGTG
jgi:Phage tail tube protein, GTA-gp10